jgi:hypothetical protein
MPIISSKSVRVVASAPLRPPLNFYLTVGRGPGISEKPLALLIQGLSPSHVGRTFTTTGGPDFANLVEILTDLRETVPDETLLVFVLSATPAGGGDFSGEIVPVHTFVPTGNAPTLLGADFTSFDLHISEFSQSDAGNGLVTGSITVDFTINGYYPGVLILLRRFALFLFGRLLNFLRRFFFPSIRRT